jgi:hypothetical protein
MNTDLYHYRMNQTYRDRIQRAAHKHNLMRLALQRRPKSPVAFNAALTLLVKSLFR